MTRVILTLMIKNEERIVVRCIDRALRVADAVCVCDTGSTDATLSVLGVYLPTLAVPTKLVRTPWVDFGTCRTESMRATVTLCDELGWDKRSSYSLVLDADMILCVSDAFDKTCELRCSAYRMRQESASLVYYNTRLMRLSDPWVCVGPTHEYWRIDSAGLSSQLEQQDELDTEPRVLEDLYIDDVGDGGCKSDKFERDERLLRAALETEPTNARYIFYLAQTLRDRGDTESAIEWYKRRAEAGHWVQEVWYSMYQVCALYYKLRKLPEMEYWGLKAHEALASRAECVCLLVRAFREEGEHHKAWHYYELGRRIERPGADALFVEPEVYSRLFEYERTILSYYVLGPAAHAESLRDIVRYMNVHGTSETTWSNMEFYVSRVPSTRIRALPFPRVDEYVASSVSVLRLSGAHESEPESAYKLTLNVRYVNYAIAPDGTYVVDGAVRTRNFRARCDLRELAALDGIETLETLGALEEMTAVAPDSALRADDDREPLGLEDLRLYYAADEVRWVAAEWRNGAIEQVTGTYDVRERKLSSAASMALVDASTGKAIGKRHEKNWIPLAWHRAGPSGPSGPSGPMGETFVYEWHPFTVVVVARDASSVVVAVVKKSAQPTPRFFERIRGSSNVVEYEGLLYAVAHLVCHGSTCRRRRRYYHVVVRLTVAGPNGTLGTVGPVVLEAYTMPFYFARNQIEYCLGIEVREGTLFAFVSQNDADPVVVDIPLRALHFVPLTVDQRRIS